MSVVGVPLAPSYLVCLVLLLPRQLWCVLYRYCTKCQPLSPFLSPLNHSGAHTCVGGKEISRPRNSQRLQWLERLPYSPGTMFLQRPATVRNTPDGVCGQWSCHAQVRSSPVHPDHGHNRACAVTRCPTSFNPSEWACGTVESYHASVWACDTVESFHECVSSLYRFTIALAACSCIGSLVSHSQDC